MNSAIIPDIITKFIQYYRNITLLSVFELERHLSPLQVTADFVCIRLHGPGNKYQGSYSDASLKKWAKYCLEWKKENKDVFIYFDNDQLGYAAFNAQRLISFVEKMSETNKVSN